MPALPNSHRHAFHFVKPLDNVPRPELTYMKSFLESSGLLSLGQYGHLNLDPLLNLPNDSCATT